MTTYSPTLTAELRRCITCGVEKRLTEFRLRRRGKPERRSQCRRCHNAEIRERRARLTARKFSNAAAKIAQATQDDAARVVTLVSRLIRAFGGIQRLTVLYHQTVQSALAANPTSPATATLLLAVLKLQLLSDSLASDAPLPATLEERRKTLAREFANYITSNPREIAELLNEIGWLVVPPNAASRSIAAADQTEASNASKSNANVVSMARDESAIMLWPEPGLIVSRPEPPRSTSLPLSPSRVSVPASPNR